MLMPCQLIRLIIAFSAVNGEWTLTAKSKTIPDPLNGEPFIKLPDTQLDEIEPYVQSLLSVPKSGLHNPLKNPERCRYDPLWNHALTFQADCSLCINRTTHLCS